MQFDVTHVDVLFLQPLLNMNEILFILAADVGCFKAAYRSDECQVAIFCFFEVGGPVCVTGGPAQEYALLRLPFGR